MALVCSKCRMRFDRSQALGGHLWYVHGIQGASGTARRRGPDAELINPALAEIVVDIGVLRGRSHVPLKRFKVHGPDPQAVVAAVRKLLQNWASSRKK